MDVIKQFAKIWSYGPANFIYTDVDAFFVRSHDRIKADGKIAQMGLFNLSRFYQYKNSLAVYKTELQKYGNKEKQVSLVVCLPISG